MKKEFFADQPSEQIREYWQIISRGKWWILFLTLAITLGAASMITRLANVYQATTTILVDPQQVSDQYVNPPVKEALTDRMQTITQQVLSATRLQEIIDKYYLYPELRTAMSREQIIEHMRKAVTIEVKHGSGNGPGAFAITYEGSNPQTVAQVANELAARFIEWNLQSSEQVAEVTTEFLGEQLQHAKTGLEQQESKVRDFKLGHLGEMPDSLAANLGTLAGLRATYQSNSDSLNRLEQERIELTRLPIGVTRTGQPVPEGLSERGRLEMEKVRLEEQLRGLRQRYTPTHPEIAEVNARLLQVKQELKVLPVGDPDSQDATPTQVRMEIIAREMKRLNEQQKQNAALIASYQAKVDAMPLREQQLTDLMRDYEISKDQYRTLLGKKYSADMAGDLQRKQKGVRFTILDPARPPERPVKPQRGLLALASAIGAFFFSIALVIGKDRLDETVKAERQLEGILPESVALLAAIPTIDTPSDKRRRVHFTILALSISLLVCLAVAALLWGGLPIA
ncbi:MAG TPA: GNVR domain-containing protein [Candidatus Acidoferrales bacterium]|nr:GNVR domain-containing protein [Candidatus Acidoferrales bacterium]